MWKRLSPAFIATMLAFTLAIATMAILGGCAASPKPDAKAPDAVVSVIRLDACDKPWAYVVITADGAVHEVPAYELSKEHVDGIDQTAQGLPDGNAGALNVPCIPTQKTRL